MVLVYCKTPKGILYLDGYRIYGQATGHDPVDLPAKIYLTCRDALTDAAYREGFLSKLYKKQFPVVAFTYTGLKYMPESLLDTIGPLMVKKYRKRWSFKAKVEILKASLRSKSPCLSNQ